MEKLAAALLTLAGAIAVALIMRTLITDCFQSVVAALRAVTG